jgi:hypothetical protein
LYRRRVFVSLTYTSTDDAPGEEGRIVGEEMDRWLREIEGFEGFLLLTRGNDAVGLAFWSDEETAERYSALRAEFRERMLTIAGARIERVEGYDVVYQRLGPGFEPAG